MNQPKRRIVKGLPQTTTEKVSFPILPQVLQILSKSEKGVYRYVEENGLTPNVRFGNGPAMTVKFERDVIAEFSILIFLFLSYAASSAGSS